MLDVSLFRHPAFLGVQLATFCIGAGMFALFPFLSIYLQDIDGNSPLGAGLRFLPITAFIFFVPLVTRRPPRAISLWLLLSVSLAVVALGLLLMETVSAGSQWTVLLPGFIVCRHRDRARQPDDRRRRAARRRPGAQRHGLGHQQHLPDRRPRARRRRIRCAASAPIGDRLTAAGYPGKALAVAVSSSGLRAAAGRPAWLPVANAAFVSGFRLVILIGCLTLCGRRHRGCRARTLTLGCAVAPGTIRPCRRRSTSGNSRPTGRLRACRSRRSTRSCSSRSAGPKAWTTCFRSSRT